MPTADVGPTRGEITERAILQAIVRMEKGRAKIVARNRKLSISAVAEEAGVSRATIHNNHPALADRIRQSANKSSRSQRDRKSAELKAERDKNKELRDQVKQLRQLNIAMASELATLTAENDRLRSGPTRTHVVSFSKRQLT